MSQIDVKELRQLVEHLERTRLPIAFELVQHDCALRIVMAPAPPTAALPWQIAARLGGTFEGPLVQAGKVRKGQLLCVLARPDGVRLPVRSPAGGMLQWLSATPGQAIAVGDRLCAVHPESG